MEIRFQCDLADYREAQLAHIKGSTGYYVMIVLGCMAVLFGSYQAYSIDFGLGLITQLVGIFWLLWPTILKRSWLKRDFRKHPNFAVPQVLIVGEEGLQTSSELGGGIVKWPAFTKFKETKNLFMLYMGARMFRVVPKRAIPTAQVNDFRTLVKNKLPGA